MRVIPSVPQCYRLMTRYRMLPNIKEHSLVVAAISGLLSQGLNRAGLDIPLDLVLAGALLHDIGKSICFETGEEHARKGEEICLSHDLPEVAAIVGNHIILSPNRPPLPTAQEIVYYADKRVNHDSIVSLDERELYILEIYGRDNDFLQEKIRENFGRCRRLEEEIFQHLNFPPEDLALQVEKMPPLPAGDGA